LFGRLTTGQLSYEASNGVAAAFGVTTIALALGRFCFGLSAPICRKCSAYVNLFLELTGFVTPDVASIPSAWLYHSAFTRLS
jgi:hypothetical protein